MSAHYCLKCGNGPDRGWFCRCDVEGYKRLVAELQAENLRLMLVLNNTQATIEEVLGDVQVKHSNN